MTRCKCAELLRPVPRETPHHEVVAGVVANSTGLSQAEDAEELFMDLDRRLKTLRHCANLTALQRRQTESS